MTVGLCFVENEGDGEQELAAPEQLATMGCAVKVHHVHHEDDKVQFIAQGVRRFRIDHWLSRKPPYLVEVTYPDEPVEDREQVKAYTLAIISSIKELLRTNPLYGEEVKHYLSRFGVDDSSPCGLRAPPLPVPVAMTCRMS